MRALAFFPNNGTGVWGKIEFEQVCACQPVVVSIEMHGPPNEVHAIHVHQWGDVSGGCATLGTHYDGGVETTHGSIYVPDRPRHAGDMINNLQFGRDGQFRLQYVDELLTLFGAQSIYGRSVVIHQDRDDLGLGKGKAMKESLKTGNAGGRIACAIIAKISD